MKNYASSARIAGRGRFLAVRAVSNEETLMSFRNERFNRKFFSLDLIKQGDNSEKRDFLSDGGRGAQAVRDFLDLKEGQTEEELEAEERQKCHNERLNDLKKQLSEAGLGWLIPVLELVVANGRNRKLSVLRLCKRWRQKKAVARVKYHQGVRALLTFISTNKIKG